MVARHTRYDGTIDTGTAGTEQHQCRHQHGTAVCCACCICLAHCTCAVRRILFAHCICLACCTYFARQFLLFFPRSLQPGKHSADPLLHHQPGPVDPLSQMHGQTDRSPHDDRKNHRRHIFHQHHRTDTHCHGACSENRVQIFLERLADLIPRQRSHNPSNNYYQRIYNDSDWHTALSSMIISRSNLSSVLFTTSIRKQISIFPLLIHQDRSHPPLTFGGIILLFRQHTLHNFPVK